jgi:hypothetical protein
MGNNQCIGDTGCINDAEEVHEHNFAFTSHEESQDWIPFGRQVFLNIYHLDNNWTDANHVSKQVFGLGGAFHAGIEVHGCEWSYGGEGISCGEPRSHHVHVYNESIPLGESNLTVQRVHNLVANMASRWRGDDYNMLEKNCCNFADALSLQLVGYHVPQWVMRFPQLASKAAAHLNDIVDVKGLLQQSHASHAGPVGAAYETNRNEVSPARGRPGYVCAH